MEVEHEQKLHSAKDSKLELNWRLVSMGVLAYAGKQLAGEEKHPVLTVRLQEPSEAAFSLLL